MAQVQRRFEKGLAATVRLHLSRFQSIERLLKFAPPEIWQRLKAHETYHFNQLTIVDLSAPGSPLGALPFGHLIYLR